MFLRETYLARVLNSFEVRKGKAPDNMRVLKANASFASASIVGLADLNHADIDNTLHAFGTVSQYAKTGDTFLVEGVARGSKAPFMNGIQTVGWDDMAAFEETPHIIKEQLALKELTDAAKIALDEKDYRKMRSLLDEHKKRLADMSERLRINTATRDEFLVGALEDVRSQSPMNRVFLFAGAKHLLESPSVLKRLRRERFVILSAKVSREISPEDNEDYISEMIKNI